MNAMTDANSLFSEPMSLLAVLAWIIIGFMLRTLPRPVPVPARIALGSPRLVALDPGEAALASRLLGSVAADCMAELERWR